MGLANSTAEHLVDNEAQKLAMLTSDVKLHTWCGLFRAMMPMLP
jgi:hypothetical protein